MTEVCRQFRLQQVVQHHTLYLKTDLYGDSYDPETETIHQQNILNCVYLGGETLDISGLSGINTLRTVLNRLFDLDYDMVEPRSFINYYP